MRVIGFFENLFSQFGNLMDFMSSQVKVIDITAPLFTIDSQNGTIWHGVSTINMDIWSILSIGLVGLLGICLSLHLWHLCKVV